DCEFAGKEYPIGAFLEDTCMVMWCNEEGSWIFIDDDFNPECGNCIATQEPQIYTYEHNTNNYLNDYGHTSKTGYYYTDDGYFVLSQSGLHILGEFGVYANFTACENFTSWACIDGLTYYEPGITITLVDPLGIHDPHPLGDIKVYVNNEERTIDDSVSSFYGEDGPVLVFKNFHVQSLPTDTPLDCINIVGCKGLSVNYCQNKNEFDSIWIWAMPHLKAQPTAAGDQTSGQLYGLCDQYTITGNELEYYTCQNGTQYYGSAMVFGDTWQYNP
ncbi:unnamed protein product, partial [Meganyctiphanes norvegica]